MIAGVGAWVPEQALREIYLRAFELPITIGGAYNTMASFARLGTIAGPSDGTLAQTFLRGECGMKGIVVTDMYTDMNGKQDNSPYFELAYGIYTTMALVSFVFVVRLVRETRGRELEDME